MVSYGRPPGVPELIPVSKPSHIVATFYDSMAGGIVYLDFGGPLVYAYHDVPYPVYEALLAAEHPGSYFHANIRKASPAYRTVKHEKPVIEGG